MSSGSNEYNGEISILALSRLDGENVIAGTKNFPKECNLFNDLIALYVSLSDTLRDKGITEEKLVEYNLFWISLRSLFISSQLMFAAHQAESYTILSRAVEAAGYSNHIRLDQSKANIWIVEKKDSKVFYEAFKKPRFIGKETAAIKDIYAHTRLYGVHTNLESTLFHQKKDESNRYNHVYTDILNVKNLHRILLYSIYSFNEVLKVFKLSFEDKLDSSWSSKFSEFQAKMRSRLGDVESYFKDHADLE